MCSELRQISRAEGHVFWLFGLSGAGKSALATALITDLRTRGFAVLALDGDALRAGLGQGLGFSDSDRTENLRRAVEVAKLGVTSGLCVVASFITPRSSHRQLISQIVGAANLSTIHVDAPLAVCVERDPKALYARARAGQVTQMTGLSSAFEAPLDADLVIRTASEEITLSSAKLLGFALARLARTVS